MGPSIGNSIKQGFAAATKSWGGIGVFVGCWAVALGIVFLAIMLTRPPAEVFEEGRPVTPLITPDQPAPTEPSSETPTTPEPSTTDLFNELSTTNAPDAAAVPEAAQTVTQTLTEEAQAAAAQAEAQRQDEIIGEWFRHAWPLLLLGLIILIGASHWINGGQIGYLAKRVISGQASVSDFISAGTRSVVRLLGATGISILGLVAFVLLGVLLVMGVSAIARVAPTWLDIVLGILGLVLGLGAVVGVIWLLVRLTFWLMAIVIDQLGPIAGLKRSFQVSRGHWWKIVGLGLVAGLISYGIWIPLGLIEWLAGFVGGPVEGLVSLITNLLGLVASLFIGFALLAAYIRFYEDAKSSSGRAAAPSSPVS